MGARSLQVKWRKEKSYENNLRHGQLIYTHIEDLERGDTCSFLVPTKKNEQITFIIFEHYFSSSYPLLLYFILFFH